MWHLFWQTVFLVVSFTCQFQGPHFSFLFIWGKNSPPNHGARVNGEVLKTRCLVPATLHVPLLGCRAGGGGRFGDPCQLSQRFDSHGTSDKLCGFGQAAYFSQVQSHGQRRGADHKVLRFPGSLQTLDAGHSGAARVGGWGLALHVPGPRELVGGSSAL